MDVEAHDHDDQGLDGIVERLAWRPASQTAAATRASKRRGTLARSVRTKGRPARCATGRPPLKPGAVAGAGASALTVIGKVARAVTAPVQARRRPLCRRRPRKDTRGTRPWGAPETRTNLPYEGRLVTTGAPARAPRAVLSRPEPEAAPGAALAPSECARLAQPRAPGKAVPCKRRDDQAQLCGRLPSRRRRDPQPRGARGPGQADDGT